MNSSVFNGPLTVQGRCRSRWFVALLVPALLAALSGNVPTAIAAEVLVPKIIEPWWQITGNPDLGELTDPRQQPVDFSVWQAADGTWQLWSCIRKTKEPGHTRLFHRWEGPQLTAANWKPMGVAMHSDPKFGEPLGGLQAPHVFRHNGEFLMFYGNWEQICAASSQDGKFFQRRPNREGRTGRFGEGAETNTRDPMVIRIGNRWHCYYTAHPQRRGAVYCRTSPDLQQWSDSRIVAAGGRAGDNAYSAECPFVVELRPGQFYLFRTQRYGLNAQTSVYHSTDPLDFGVNHDAGHFVCTLPIAAPEIVEFGGKYYVVALLPSLKGIQVARLEWVSP